MMVGGLVNAAVAAVSVVIEGSNDEYPHYLNLGVEPVIETAAALVPLRAVAEDLGYQVTWEPSTSGINIAGDGKIIKMHIGSREAFINSIPYNMPVEPRLLSGTTLCPVRFMSEALGYHVEYSTAWNTPQIFITPYNLISDSELAGMDNVNFSKSADGGFINMQLRKEGATPGGVELSSSIMDVLQVYGIPRSPNRNLNYSADWSGKLIYWGTFIPQSDIGTFLEFVFEKGVLTDLTISY